MQSTPHQVLLFQGHETTGLHKRFLSCNVGYWTPLLRHKPASKVRYSVDANSCRAYQWGDGLVMDFSYGAAQNREI